MRLLARPMGREALCTRQPNDRTYASVGSKGVVVTALAYGSVLAVAFVVASFMMSLSIAH